MKTGCKKLILTGAISLILGISGTALANESESGTVDQNQWSHFGPYQTSDAGFLAEMTGTNDADLYVKRGSQPTASSYDCRPYLTGSEETCGLEGAGNYYVSVKGYSSQASDFDLELIFNEGDGSGSTGGGGGPVVEDPNLALQATASAEESYYSNSEQNLNDGNDSTKWYSDAYYNGKTVWVQLDWDESKAMDFMEIKWDASFYPYQFDVWVHSNGSWVDLGTEACNGTDSIINLDMNADSVWLLLKQSNGSYFGINDIVVE
jgi:hypothetical protein